MFCLNYSDSDEEEKGKNQYKNIQIKAKEQGFHVLHIFHKYTLNNKKWQKNPHNNKEKK